MEQLAALDPDSLYVRTYLYGGLGNQLFQCAAGRSLAARVGARLDLDVSSYRRPDEYRRFCLDGFAIDADVMDDDSPPLPNFDRPGKSISMPLRRWIAKHGGGGLGSGRSANRSDRSKVSRFPE